MRLERYVKDMLIEMHTLKEMVDTLVLPAAFSYAGSLAERRRAREVGGDQDDPAGRRGERDRRDDHDAAARRRTRWQSVIDKAEGMHDDLPKQAKFLTSTGADAMAAARAASDALELLVADELWPLPKYREMLFPV